MNNQKETTGNTGEWSELYALAFLLANGGAYGADKNQDIKKDFDDSGIDGVLSENIQRDALEKFSYVSPIGAAGLYYHATAADFQREGEQREAFKTMIREIAALAEAMGVPFERDMVEVNLKILSSLAPEATTSMQRDVMEGKDLVILVHLAGRNLARNDLAEEAVGVVVVKASHGGFSEMSKQKEFHHSRKWRRPKRQTPARPRPAATVQGPPRRTGGVPLPELRSNSREGGRRAAPQGVAPHHACCARSSVARTPTSARCASSHC